MWHRDRYRCPASRAFVDIPLDVCAGLAADLVALSRAVVGAE